MVGGEEAAMDDVRCSVVTVMSFILVAHVAEWLNMITGEYGETLVTLARDAARLVFGTGSPRE